MSERFFCDPPEQVWVMPSDPADLAPLPAILHSYTEHEIIVSEYDRKSKQFLLAERERRTQAFKNFATCRLAMLDRQSTVLEKAKAEYQNQASIYSHLDSMVPAAYPEEAFKSFIKKPEPEEVPDLPPDEPIQEQAKPATQRPSRRRR
jgi:hypothetical protein